MLVAVNFALTQKPRSCSSQADFQLAFREEKLRIHEPLVVEFR